MNLHLRPVLEILRHMFPIFASITQFSAYHTWFTYGIKLRNSAVRPTIGSLCISNCVSASSSSRAIVSRRPTSTCVLSASCTSPPGRTSSSHPSTARPLASDCAGRSSRVRRPGSCRRTAWTCERLVSTDESAPAVQQQHKYDRRRLGKIRLAAAAAAASWRWLRSLIPGKQTSIYTSAYRALNKHEKNRKMHKNTLHQLNKLLVFKRYENMMVENKHVERDDCLKWRTKIWRTDCDVDHRCRKMTKNNNFIKYNTWAFSLL